MSAPDFVKILTAFSFFYTSVTMLLLFGSYCCTRIFSDTGILPKIKKTSYIFALALPGWRNR